MEIEIEIFASRNHLVKIFHRMYPNSSMTVKDNCESKGNRSVLEILEMGNEAHQKRPKVHLKP